MALEPQMARIGRLSYKPRPAFSSTRVQTRGRRSVRLRRESPAGDSPRTRMGVFVNKKTPRSRRSFRGKTQGRVLRRKWPAGAAAG